MSLLRFWSRGAALAILVGLAISPAFAGTQSEDYFQKKRQTMVRTQIMARGIKEPSVLKAMAEVPRHLFVPKQLWLEAYEDYPLPIGGGQTISQPYIVALMTELLEVNRGDRVLEVGTGSGYQAAILAKLTDHVFSVEIDSSLAQLAGEKLKQLGFPQVKIKSGDGFFGWPEEAPFNGIMVTCAAPSVPEPLFDQLAENGRLVIPLGESWSTQILTVIVKKQSKPVVKRVLDVRFVPMTGEVQKKKK